MNLRSSLSSFFTNIHLFVRLETLGPLYSHALLEFFLNVSLNSVAKIFVITVKGLELATQPALVLETRMLPQCQQDTCERQDL